MKKSDGIIVDSESADFRIVLEIKSIAAKRQGKECVFKGAKVRVFKKEVLISSACHGVVCCDFNYYSQYYSQAEDFVFKKALEAALDKINPDSIK